VAASTVHARPKYMSLSWTFVVRLTLELATHPNRTAMKPDLDFGFGF